MSTHSKNENCLSTVSEHDCFSPGDWFYWRCEYAKAQQHFEQILNQSLSLPDPTLAARCYKSLAATEVQLKHYDKAIDIYNKELDVLRKMCQSTNKNEDIMSCYISIGKVYWLKRDYNKAIEYHRQALDYTESSPNRISTIYKNLANIYTNTKQFDLSLDYFEKALEIDNEQCPKNYLQIGQTYANMAAMYLSKQSSVEALNYFRKARETLLNTILETHVAIEKIDKTIYKIVNPSDILARNNIMILWLDEYIGRDENCRALKTEFRQITNSLKMVDSVDSFRECLRHVKDRKLFCIIQGKHAREVVPDIAKTVSPSMEPIVYIFCLHMQYLNEWAQEQECIMRGGMFDHEGDLFDRLKRDVNDYVKQNTIDEKEKLPSKLVIEFLERFVKISGGCFQEKNSIVPFDHTTTSTA